MYLQNIFDVNARWWRKNSCIENATDLSGATKIEFFHKFDALVVCGRHDQSIINETIFVQCNLQ